MNETTTIARASFFLGLGTMGLISGLGFGAKDPNKLALLIGVGSLAYANYLNPVLQTDPNVSSEFRRSAAEARSRIPTWNPPTQRPRGEVRFAF